MQFLSQDHPASFKEHSKKHIRFMEAIEKTKRELCLEGVTEVMMDVSDFFDDEDDIEISFDQFEEACRPTTTLFTQQVDAFLTVCSLARFHIGVAFSLVDNRRHSSRRRQHAHSLLDAGVGGPCCSVHETNH